MYIMEIDSFTVHKFSCEVIQFVYKSTHVIWEYHGDVAVYNVTIVAIEHGL